jgi:BolA family transcriptional regulator, general stress-responsive regulator
MSPADSPRDLIEDCLRRELEAVHVEVSDQSAHHAGHAGAAGGGHYSVLIVSPRFEGLTRLEAQRLVYAAMGDLMASAVHALQMRTLTPAEWTRRRSPG